MQSDKVVQNRIVSCLLIFLFVLMIAHHVQIARLVRFNNQLVELQQMQETLIEENKRIMAARELIRDPQTIKKIAETELNYQLLDIDRVIYLETQ